MKDNANKAEEGFFDRFSLNAGEENKKILSTPKAREFVKNSLKNLYSAFNEVKKSIPVEYHQDVVVNIYLAQMAFESAYLDLERATQHHDLKGGPSPAKMAGALTSWVNRIKPIQIKRDVDATWVGFTNPIVSLQLGVTVYLEKTKRGGGDVMEVLRDNGTLNDLIYHIVWRDPSYRELSILYQGMFGA